MTTHCIRPTATDGEILLEVQRRLGGGFRWPSGTRVTSREIPETPFTYAEYEWQVRMPGHDRIVMTFTQQQLEDARCPREYVVDSIARRIRQTVST